ncbi:MAG: hypothetical protein IPK61_07725 [Saprospiraceae bacterium]|nr:hypothetical protein [Saprospiraceae bacterium]
MIALIQKRITWSIILLIQTLFLFKYLYRIAGEWSYVLCCTFLLGMVYLIQNERINQFTLHRKMLALFIGAFLVMIMFLLSRIPFENLQVDRWSVISSFWTQVFHHQYAYEAISHLGNHPCPLPFYFIVSLPFYLIGDVALLSLASLLVFIYYLAHKKNNSFLFISTLFVFPVFVYEVLTRSTILTFSLICLIYFDFLFSTDKKSNISSILFSAVLGGMVLCTRNVYGGLFLISSVYFLLENYFGTVTKWILWNSVVLTSFCLLFLPFIWGHTQVWQQYNPFLTQSDKLFPEYLSIIVLLIALGSGCWINVKNYNFIFGSWLFLVALIYMGDVTATYGWNEAFFSSKADITYFILGIPFLYAHLASEETAVAIKI